MTTLSTHVLDIERGAPAVGVPIALYRGDQALALVETNADGRIADVSRGWSL
jgi:5-hydroxyisourate hydrolase-like protein (transthyretin family)